MEPDTKTKGGTRPAQQPQQQLLRQENRPTMAALPAGASPSTTTAPARLVEARANVGAGAKLAAALEQSEKQQQPVGLPAAAAVPAETGGSMVGLPAAPTNAGASAATPGVVRKEADNPNPSAQVVAKQKGNTTAAPQARTAPAAKSVPGSAQPAKTELRGLDAIVEAALPTGTEKAKPEQAGRMERNGKGNGDEGGSSSGSTGSAEKLTKQDKNEFAREQNPEDEPARKAGEQQGQQEADRTEKLPRPSKVASCPRCNSLNTKFCYYNNYNVNQPRHFCKACQRYWTEGGTLRNVPVGAGRRKSKNQRSNGANTSKQGEHDVEKALIGIAGLAEPAVMAANRNPGVVDSTRIQPTLPGTGLERGAPGLDHPVSLPKGADIAAVEKKDYSPNERQKSPDGSGDGSAEGSSIRVDMQMQRNTAQNKGSDADHRKRPLKSGIRQRSMTTCDTMENNDGSGGDGSGSGSGSGSGTGGYRKGQGTKDGSRTWAQVISGMNSQYMNGEANKQQAPRPGGPVVAPGGNWAARQMINSMPPSMSPYGYPPAPWPFGWPQYPPGWHENPNASGRDSQKNSQNSNSMQFASNAQTLHYPPPWMYNPGWQMGPQPQQRTEQETSTPSSTNAAVQVMAQGPWPAWMPGMLPPWLFSHPQHEQQQGGHTQQRGIHEQHTNVTERNVGHAQPSRVTEQVPGANSQQQQMFQMHQMASMAGIPYGPPRPMGQVQMQPVLPTGHPYQDMHFNMGMGASPDPNVFMPMPMPMPMKGMVQGLEDDASGPENLVHSQNPSKGLQKQQQQGVRNDANGMKP